MQNLWLHPDQVNHIHILQGLLMLCICIQVWELLRNEWKNSSLEQKLMWGGKTSLFRLFLITSRSDKKMSALLSKREVFEQFLSLFNPANFLLFERRCFFTHWWYIKEPDNSGKFCPIKDRYGKPNLKSPTSLSLSFFLSLSFPPFFVLSFSFSYLSLFLLWFLVLLFVSNSYY